MCGMANAKGGSIQQVKGEVVTQRKGKAYTSTGKAAAILHELWRASSGDEREAIQNARWVAA